MIRLDANMEKYLDFYFKTHFTKLKIQSETIIID